ncbi:MAG: Fur family transcriptional regulator [bacterium]
MEVLIQNLKKNNLKVTPQRLVIYSFLSGNRSHPSAEEVHRGITPLNPTISLATVYKTLSSLKTANLIQEINVGEDSSRYDIQVEPHAHLICSNCNSITDYFPDHALKNFTDEAKSVIGQNAKFEINYSQIYFYGICCNCSAPSLSNFKNLNNII